MEREINLVCIGCSSLCHGLCLLSRYELLICILRLITKVFKTNDDLFGMLESISYSNTFTHLLLPCYNIVNNTSAVHCTCSYMMNAMDKTRRNSETATRARCVTVAMLLPRFLW